MKTQFLSCIENILCMNWTDVWLTGTQLERLMLHRLTRQWRKTFLYCSWGRNNKAVKYAHWDEPVSVTDTCWRSVGHLAERMETVSRASAHHYNYLFPHFHCTPEIICWGSGGTLTCFGWNNGAWNHQGLAREWHSSPPERLQSLHLKPQHRSLRTTVSPLAGRPGLVDNGYCGQSCWTGTWSFGVWQPSQKVHLPACQENIISCYGNQVFFKKVLSPCNCFSPGHFLGRHFLMFPWVW